MTRARVRVGFAFAIALAACRRGPDAAGAAADAGAAAVASSAPSPPSELVAQSCRSCHSEDMLRQQRLTGAQWKKVVEKMVGWGSPLEPEHAERVAAWLAETYGGEHPVSWEPPSLASDAVAAAVAPLPDGPLAGGDPARGAATFAGLCAACHGADARGKIGPNLTDRPLLDRASDFAERVRKGAGRMPPLPLDDRTLADLVAHLRAVP